MKTSLKLMALALIAFAIAALTGCVSPVPATKIYSYEKQGDYVHVVQVKAAPNVDLSGFTSQRKVTTLTGDKIESKIGIEKAQSTNSPAVIDSAYKGYVEVIKASGDVAKGVAGAIAEGAAKGAK